MYSLISLCLLAFNKNSARCSLLSFQIINAHEFSVSTPPFFYFVLFSVRKLIELHRTTIISTFKFPILTQKWLPMKQEVWLGGPRLAVSDQEWLRVTICLGSCCLENRQVGFSISLTLLIFSNLDYRPSAESLPPLPANWQILAWVYLFFLQNFAKSNRNSQNSVFFHPLPLQLQVQKHLVWLPIITDYSSPSVLPQDKCHKQISQHILYSFFYLLSHTKTMPELFIFYCGKTPLPGSNFGSRI